MCCFKEIPNIDMVSIGANIIGAHTTNEEVSIESIENLKVSSGNIMD